MRTLFSTADKKPKDSFRRWQEMIFERLVPVELTPTGDQPFRGTLGAAEVGPLLITRITQSAIATEATRETIRRHAKHDTLNVAIILKDEVFSSQDDRISVQRPGDIIVLDRRPTTMASAAETQTLFLEVPRVSLERPLGPTRCYTALTIGADLPGTSMVTTFFDELVRTYDHLTPGMAARMASIGIDLLIASIAERLSQAPPENLQATLIVQRASAYIEDNLGDVDLDPPQLASALGISLRYLQELFQAQDRNISNWIWRRRLEVAAQRLADPGFAHVAIGALAYGCGFSN